MPEGDIKPTAVRLGAWRAIRTVVAGTIGAALSGAIAHAQAIASGLTPPNITADTAFWVAAALLLGGALSGLDKYLRESGFYGRAG